MCPGPIKSIFGGHAIGVANEDAAAIAIVISNACGSQPIAWAMEMPIGAITAAVAVLDMNCVRKLVAINIAAQIR